MFESVPRKDSGEEPEVEPSLSDAPRESHSNGELDIATLIGFSGSGSPLVRCSGTVANTGISAITTIPLRGEHIGRQLALMYVDGNPQAPVIIGLIRSQLDDMLEHFGAPSADDALLNRAEEAAELREESPEDEKRENKEGAAGLEEAYVDGKRVEINAEDEIVLKCGESSITLTKSGKIMIRGTYLLNRSSGVNRVLGGTVQIN